MKYIKDSRFQHADFVIVVVTASAEAAS